MGKAKEKPKPVHTADERRVALRLTDEQTSHIERIQAERGASRSEVVRELIDLGLEPDRVACEIKAIKDEIIETVRRASWKGTRASFTLFALATLEKEKRLCADLCEEKELFKLCWLASEDMMLQKGVPDIARAISCASRKMRATNAYKKDDELIEYVSELNSQVIFDSLDKDDIEPWIVNMAAYRRADKIPERMLAKEAPRKELLRMLHAMGIECVDDARTYLENEAFVYSKDSGWKEALGDGWAGRACSVCVAELTDAIDSLDPHPENYSATGLASTWEEVRCERYQDR